MAHHPYHALRQREKRKESLADRSTSRETVTTVIAHRQRHDVSRIRSAACNLVVKRHYKWRHVRSNEPGSPENCHHLNKLVAHSSVQRIQPDESGVRQW